MKLPIATVAGGKVATSPADERVAAAAEATATTGGDVVTVSAAAAVAAAVALDWAASATGLTAQLGLLAHPDDAPPTPDAEPLGTPRGYG